MKNGNTQRCHSVTVILLVLQCGIAGMIPAVAMADEGAGDRMFDSVAVFAGQGVDHNLKEIPGRILGGNPKWDKSFFNAIGLSRSVTTLGEASSLFWDTPMSGIMQGFELVLAQHHGMQGNAEVGAAYTLKTPDLWMDELGVNFSSGIGLSYALGTPSYEDGSASDPGRRYRLQQLLLFDLEWKIRGQESWSLVTRVHHRSGVYGLIAPPRVGSNFLAAGIRYSF